MKSINKSALLLFSMLFLLNFSITAQDNDAIELGNLHSGELEYSAFEILEKSTVNIEGKAGHFGSRFSQNMVFYGWIINSKTREVIWDARETFDFEDRSGMYAFEDHEPLDKGIYEVYYTCNRGYNDEINSFSDVISKFFSGSGKSKFKNRYREELEIIVYGEKGKFVKVDPHNVLDQILENSVVSIVRVNDSEDSKSGFSLSGETTLRIYSVGEGREGNLFDLAWISDANSNKVVWKASLSSSAHAGGGKKNYLIDETIELPAGTYFLHYSSDDSHSFEDWNVMPPNDPQFWGAAIWADSPKDEKNVIPFKEEDVVKPMVEIIRVGDDEYRSQGFTLPRDTEINILSLGEGYDEDDMADYGWIINADTKELVWTMNDNPNMEPAGGAKKNRKVEEILTLDKGNYIAFYTTDDSHSYEEWNSYSPLYRERWGLTIWADTKNYKLFDADSYKSKNLIAEIIKVGDHEKHKESFTLSKNTRIRIYAIGEGTKSGMDDYGWIEDSEGDVIWEMTYRKTNHAGGASKNRLFNDTISLDAGRYTLHYKSDGSHSYEDWNSSPPINQNSYGISLFLNK